MNQLLVHKEKGSYTVEISLIMPVVLSVILLILYFSIYVHDRCVIEYAIIKVTAGTYDIVEYDDLIYEAEYMIGNILDKCLIASWDWDTDVEGGEKEFRLIVKANMRHSQGLISGYVLDRLFSVKEAIEIPCGNEYEHISRSDDGI